MASSVICPIVGQAFFFVIGDLNYCRETCNTKLHNFHEILEQQIINATFGTPSIAPLSLLWSKIAKMASSPDSESEKPEPQLDSTHDSGSDSEISSKPQPPTGYNLPLWRKCLILFVVSWMTLAVTFSSTSLLPATPEIASEFSTTTEILNVINAGVLIAMGFSSFIWGPITDLFGRRSAYNAAIMVLCACSAGTAVAINLHMFIAMRLLCGFTGTFFMVAGQTIIADIFEPVSHFLSLLLGGRVSDDIHVIGRARDSRGLYDGWFSQWSCNRYVYIILPRLYFYQY